MVKAIRVQPEGCISETSSDISPNWKNMRSVFGYVMCSMAVSIYTRGRNNNGENRPY